MTTVIPRCKITVSSINMRACNAFTVDRSIWNIKSTAVIKIPLSGQLKNTDGSLQNVLLSKQFKAGDKVTIQSGYNVISITEFNGYVRRVNQTMPLELECEDYSWVLHKVNANKIYKNIKLKEFLEDIAKLTAAVGYDKMQYSTQLEMTIDKLNCEKMNCYQALDELKKRFGLNVFFSIDNVLQVALAYSIKLAEVKYQLQKVGTVYPNVIDISNLKYMDANDARIRIVAISYDSNMKKTKVEIGEKQDETRTINYFGITDKVKLKALAEKDILKYKYTGYKGTFKTFLLPFAEPCMIGKLMNDQFTEREGKYYIEAVKTEFLTSGARRDINISVKL